MKRNLYILALTAGLAQAAENRWNIPLGPEPSFAKRFAAFLETDPIEQLTPTCSSSNECLQPEMQDNRSTESLPFASSFNFWKQMESNAPQDQTKLVVKQSAGAERSSEVTFITQGRFLDW